MRVTADALTHDRSTCPPRDGTSESYRVLIQPPVLQPAAADEA